MKHRVGHILTDNYVIHDLEDLPSLCESNYLYQDLTFDGCDYRDYEFEDDIKFSDCHFDHVDFRGARLGCHFQNCIFEFCDFTGANMQLATTLTSVFEHCVGILRLPVGDERGYDCMAVRTKDGFWKILAGCRWYSINEALQHWGVGSNWHRYPHVAKRYVRAVTMLADGEFSETDTWKDLQKKIQNTIYIYD